MTSKNCILTFSMKIWTSHNWNYSQQWLSPSLFIFLNHQTANIIISETLKNWHIFWYDFIVRVNNKGQTRINSKKKKTAFQTRKNLSITFQKFQLKTFQITLFISFHHSKGRKINFSYSSRNLFLVVLLLSLNYHIFFPHLTNVLHI